MMYSTCASLPNQTYQGPTASPRMVLSTIPSPARISVVGMRSGDVQDLIASKLRDGYLKKPEVFGDGEGMEQPQSGGDRPGATPGVSWPTSPG